MDLNMFNQIAQINDHLFLSSAGAIKQDRVRTLGITNIVNCTMEIPNLRLASVECVQIHVEDTPSARLGIYFDRCADKIHQVHKSGGKTLVHCVAGVSRSASLCIAYLMKYQRMTLDQAYYHVKKRRPVVHPNVGFWRQLIEYERRLFGRNTVNMVPSGIGPIPDVYKEETKNMVWFPSRTLAYNTSTSPRSSSLNASQNYNTTYSRSYNTQPFSWSSDTTTSVGRNFVGGTYSSPSLEAPVSSPCLGGSYPSRPLHVPIQAPVISPVLDTETYIVTNSTVPYSSRHLGTTYYSDIDLDYDPPSISRSLGVSYSRPRNSGRTYHSDLSYEAPVLSRGVGASLVSPYLDTSSTHIASQSLGSPLFGHRPYSGRAGFIRELCQRPMH